MTERLPFTLRFARSEADLRKAVAIRQSAYARHLPELAARFAVPEPSDLDGSSLVLVAESRLDGLPLGSMRFRTNRERPLDLEQSVTLPDSLRHSILAEATRLAVTHQAVGRVVKAMMMKAMFMHSINAGVSHFVVTARHPMDRFYSWLLFEDAIPGAGFIPMAHVGMIPHRVMTCDLAETKCKWAESNHPWYALFFQTHHPDLLCEITAGSASEHRARLQAKTASSLTRR